MTKVAPPDGFEPPFSVLETDVLPLDEGGVIWCSLTESNCHHRGVNAVPYH